MKCILTVRELLDHERCEAICNARGLQLPTLRKWSVMTTEITLSEAQARECGLIAEQQVNQELLTACEEGLRLYTTRTDNGDFGLVANVSGCGKWANQTRHAIANAKAQARGPSQGFTCGPFQASTPPEVTIETVRAAGRQPGIEPDWKEAYESLYRLFQRRLAHQEALMDKMLEAAHGLGRFDGAVAIAKGITDDPPRDP